MNDFYMIVGRQNGKSGRTLKELFEMVRKDNCDIRIFIPRHHGYSSFVDRWNRHDHKRIICDPSVKLSSLYPMDKDKDEEFFKRYEKLWPKSNVYRRCTDNKKEKI